MISSLLKHSKAESFKESNEWSRRHGYHSPIDSYLIMQWVCLIILDLGYFCFLLHFTTIEDTTLDGDVIPSVEQLEAEGTHNIVNPYSSWTCYVMIGFSMMVKIFSIWTSMAETEDPVVTEGNVNRSLTYVRRYGIPVIDSHTSICNICRIKVSKATRHCKLCNKCVDEMDHHCKWLNCCIGRKNYRSFIILVTSSFLALLWYSFIALNVTYIGFYEKPSFILHALNHFQMDINTVDITHLYYITLFTTCFITIISLISFISIMRLLIFHFKLARLNITTVEYLSRSMYQNFDTDEEDDGDCYSDNEIDSDESAYPSRKPVSNKGYQIHRLVTRKIRRIWITIARKILPSNRYRQLKNMKHPSWLSPFSRKKIPSRQHTMNMEELFATRTIRPSAMSEEIDYEDSMGLDMTLLDEKPKMPSRSKIARLLDMTDSETMIIMQQEQQGHHLHPS
ncbi:DHHC palmitoyltransferase-domain-containing protein [Pilobolus umbonatus]|nr:DHHC palmitoyltransferase-domain-containing protein [Pilobolus umbonatus]